MPPMAILGSVWALMAVFSMVRICRGIRNHSTAPTIAKMVPEIISELYFIFIWFTSIIHGRRPVPV